MACQGCINRQRKLVEKFCPKKPDGWICRKAKARLERMLEQQAKEKTDGR